METGDHDTVILGAGPAGLAAAHECMLRGIRAVVLEKSGHVGGIARTEEYKGYYFDVGGHRFFTKMEAVDRLWRQLMGKDLLKVPRMSRIYYNGRFFNYPLRPANALFNLGLTESARVLMSYLGSLLFPYPEETTFEQWVSNRFGKRLFQIFFQGYTEKVWGIPCDQIQADWAAQRIQGMSLSAAISNALFGTGKAKTLIDEFDYPARGPGMMWCRLREVIESGGVPVCLNTTARRIRHENGRVFKVVCSQDGGETDIPASHLITSIPLPRLIALLDPPPPEAVRKAASGLAFRDLLVVNLLVDREDLFPDQWIYVHSPDVRVGRIQNFKNWSPAMVPDGTKSSVGLEYFCNREEALWGTPDDELKRLAAEELSKLGLAAASDATDGFVVRQPDAYPVYDPDYRSHLQVVREYIGGIRNLQTIGRNGMHRYNNMDHSVYSGMLAARNIAGEHHDLWKINEEEAYLEEGPKTGPTDLARERLIAQAFARLDKLAFAVAVGTVSGLLFFLATAWLVLKGGETVGTHLRLLSQYFPGYSVTVKGAFVASGFGFLWGFLFGWLFAYLRNLMIALYVYRIKKKVELQSFREFFDHI